jgi:hypothetical protein
MDEKELDRHQHSIKGHPIPEHSKHRDTLLYSPLPFEILPADNRCDVHLFAAGISTTVNNFIQEVQTKGHPIRLTEAEWLERFAQFVEKQGKHHKKASKR